MIDYAGLPIMPLQQRRVYTVGTCSSFKESAQISAGLCVPGPAACLSSPLLKLAFQGLFALHSRGFIFKLCRHTIELQPRFQIFSIREVFVILQRREKEGHLQHPKLLSSRLWDSI